VDGVKVSIDLALQGYLTSGGEAGVDGVKVSIDLALQEGISHPAAKPEWMESRSQ